MYIDILILILYGRRIGEERGGEEERRGMGIAMGMGRV
jgi:hypothetical protein